MKMQNLILALNSKEDSYYLSNGEYETRSHILYKNANKVQVPSKKNKGKYNNCEVAFGHLIEYQGKTYWLKRCNHSASCIGHKLVPDIYDFLLTAQPTIIKDIKGYNVEGKEISPNELNTIVQCIQSINKNTLQLSDTDYDGNR